MTMSTAMATIKLTAKKRTHPDTSEEENAHPGGTQHKTLASRQVLDANPKPANPILRAVNTILDMVNTTTFQTLIYLVFVIIFKFLTDCVRIPQEFYLDKHVMDRLVENHFDASHNTFESVRRIADIYEWGNNVLWPGLFADMGPCNELVGELNSAAAKTCNDDAWPDGSGSFHQEGATPFGLQELLERMDQFDWSEGVLIRQARANAEHCAETNQLGLCYPELQLDSGSTEPFGYNYQSSGSPPPPWQHFTAKELGANVHGQRSAAIPSMREYETSGFIALAIPFFSDTFLPFQQGPPTTLIDYRNHYVNTTNGRTARFYCVRLSVDGRNLKQLCDPGVDGNGTAPYTGAVRASVEEMWNELKRRHFLSARTRLLTVTLQLKSNNVGVRYRITLMFEMTSLGAILPSYDVETRVLDSSLENMMPIYANIAFALVLFFALLEVIEVVTGGPAEYLTNVWNVMDWTNYLIYFLVWGQLQHVLRKIEHRDCSSYLCEQVGYFDDWELMASYRTMKTLLSLCVCIQLFKILKFAAILVPKMGLATSVLRKCAMDLLFFGVVFVISMLSFSTMLYIQIGPVMEAYWGQIPAVISLFRALFGDFDIQEIMNNSSGYLNALLMLGYLFVAVFIMLSMFLAILAEAQVAVREDENALRDQEGGYNEYGILTIAASMARGAFASAVTFCRCRISPQPEPSTSSQQEVTTHTTGNEVLDEVRSLRQELADLRTQMGLLLAQAHETKPIEARAVTPPTSGATDAVHVWEQEPNP
mmetsp:Transcript_6166/g.10351  ORF Transcript_6166/g.10351 Transcript_6166/m.10351 type:complete len:764 (+) Transcript_6166:170-2461(+)